MKFYIENYDEATWALISKAVPGSTITFKPDEADVIVFTGGHDVSPSIYGEMAMPQCGCDMNRDARCVSLYNTARQTGKKMIGICRGAQFLAVMLGGKLYQHIEYHSYLHWTHDGKLQINSTHHQGIIAGPHLGEIIHLSALRGQGWRRAGVCDYGITNVETFKTDKVFATQWHPEFMPYDHESVQWWVKNVNKFLDER